MRVQASKINGQHNYTVFPEQPAYFEIPQLLPYQLIPAAAIIYTPPTLPDWLILGACVFVAGFALHKLCEPDQRPRRCSGCDSASHTSATCPHIGERHHFLSDIEKIGECQCCGGRFPKTQLHHYGGRGDNSKAKEMCLLCHVQCGHEGHFHNKAINPYYCRRAA
jgi:hypothetical protein